MEIHCQTPAKIILSGEHAVLYGAPALSMAIDFPTHCHLSFHPSEPGDQPFVEIELTDYRQKHALPFKTWQNRVLNIESRFSLYEKNAISIHRVLQHPIDFILVALQQFHNAYRLKSGHWRIKIEGHALMGRGLGSSASVVVGILQGLFSHHQLAFSDADLLWLAQQVESRQHGASSGIDPTTVLKGGLLRYQQGKPLRRIEIPQFNAWLIDTGKPASTTGQAVSLVQQNHHHKSDIWEAFTQTTQAIEHAWACQESEQLIAGIRDNQRLLEVLGVVPDRVKQFMAELEEDPAVAAKVCGAGSVQGDRAGMLLCLAPKKPEALCHRYGYDLHPLQLSNTGSQCEIVSN